ncbi:hypothetical protein U1Q18_041207 [Sarracenia purpurea var. burkii]
MSIQMFDFPKKPTVRQTLMKPKTDEHSQMALMGENLDPILMGRIKEDGHKSRSESDEQFIPAKSYK